MEASTTATTASVYICKNGHRTISLWSVPATCRHVRVRALGPCGLPVVAARRRAAGRQGEDAEPAEGLQEGSEEEVSTATREFGWLDVLDDGERGGRRLLRPVRGPRRRRLVPRRHLAQARPRAGDGGRDRARRRRLHPQEQGARGPLGPTPARRQRQALGTRCAARRRAVLAAVALVGCGSGGDHRDARACQHGGQSADRAAGRAVLVRRSARLRAGGVPGRHAEGRLALRLRVVLPAGG